MKAQFVLNFFTLAAAFGLFLARPLNAAPFQEVNGQVVIEAEHFETREHDPINHWHVVPLEDGMDSFNDFGIIAANSPGVAQGYRGEGYIQAVPERSDANTTPASVGQPPYVTYLVKINTPGSYSLYLRYGGLDGNSDIMYAEIVELRTDRGGPGPNWWRYRNVAGNDLTGDAWSNQAIANDNGPAGNNAPAIWNIANPGIYTIRLSYREDGMIVDSLILQLTSLPAPVIDPTDPNLPPESAKVPDFVTIKTNPVYQDGAVGGTATFSAEFNSTGTLRYQWQKAPLNSTNFTDIAGATSASYTTPALTAADNGTQFRAKASLGSNTNVFAFSDPAILDVDVLPPVIARVNGSAGFDTVRVTFDEPVDAATATNAANYQLSGGITITRTAALNPTTVILSTSAQPQNTELTLSVRNVIDTAPSKNVIALNTTATFRTFNFTPQLITVEFFERWPGGSIESFLTGNEHYPDLPDSVQFRTVFGTSVDFRGEEFTARLRGFFIPEVTGDYVFFIAADNAGQLYLSTDESAANKHLIAEDSGGARRTWTGGNRDPLFPQNRSDTFPLSPSPRAVGMTNLWPVKDPTTGGALIHLDAGKRYYIEAIHKEGAAADYMEVTAKLSTAEDPATGSAELSGASIGAFTDPTGVSLSISNEPQDRTVPAGSRVTFTPAVQVTPAGSPVFYQWRVNGQPIAGATALSYTTDLLRAADSGKKFSLAVTTLGGITATTREATVTVPPDNTHPTITTTFASKTLSQVTIRFSEALDDSANNPANFTLRAGATALAVAGATATLDPNDDTRVVLSTAPYTAGASLQLTVNGLRDISGNAMPSTTVTIGPAAKAILYIAGTIPPNASDGAAINHLVNDFNFEVTVVDDGVVTLVDADGKDLVIGASSSGSAQVAAFALVPQPVLFWEAAAEDDFLFTADTDAARNTTAGQTQVNIVNASHPLAAGLGAGVQTIATTAQAFSWGTISPPVQATIVATIAGITNQAAIYTVQSGATLSDGTTTATARRVFFLLSDNAFTALNNAGRNLFDAAVHYAMAIPPPSNAPRMSISVQAAGNISISWDGSAGILESVEALLGQWTPVNGATSPYVTSPSGTQKFFRVRQ